MKKKLGWLLSLVLSLTLAAGGGTVLFAGADTPPSAWNDSAYFTVSGEGTAGETVVSKTDGDGAPIVNTGFMDNYLLKTDRNAVGDYMVSATFKGTKSSPYTSEVNIGVVPWYIDADNYIVVYLKWNGESNSMRCMQITGRVNGANPYIWADGFKQSQWNDLWMDAEVNRQPFLSKTPADTLTISVKKKLSEARDTDIFYGYINGVEIGFVSFRDIPKYAATPAKAGIYVCNDSITVTDFTVTDLEENVSVYDYVGDSAYIARSAGLTQGWSLENETLTLSDTGEGMYDSSMVTANVYKKSGYALETSVTTASAVNADKARSVGLYGWYKDQYNYFSLGVKEEAGTTTAYVDGVTTKEEANLVPTVASESVPLAVSFGGVTKLRVEKAGTKLSLFVNGSKAAAIEKEIGSAITDAADVGITASNMESVRFADIRNDSVGYVPYDWYLAEAPDGAGTVPFYASAQSDSAIVFTDASTFSIDVDEKETARSAGLYTATTMVGELTAGAKFTAAEGGAYGLYAWLEDVRNYARVTVSETGVEAFYVFGEETNTETYPLPQDFVYAGEHTLKTETVGRSMRITLDGAVVAEAFAIVGADMETHPYAGVLASGKDMEVKEFSYTGFWAYKAVQKGGWTVEGARNDSWSVREGTVAGNAKGGTEFKKTIAYIDYATSEDLFFAAKVKTTEAKGNEFKTGLMPYYKDADNHVFVWLSQWAGSPTNITVTARLNGQTVGSEWREQPIAYTYVGAVNEVETEISGDTLRVYLNRGFNPVFTTVIEGLSNRNMTGAKVGFNVFNTVTEFSAFDVSTKRIFTNSEKPVIAETGSRVTTANQGDEIQLPIFTAENGVGDTLTAVVKVTAPDGSEVKVNKNKFTASAVGEYTVTVTCTDVWGNEADPVTFKIAVTEKAEGGGTAEKGCGCGSVVGAGAAGGSLLLLAALGLGIALLLRRRAAR